MKSIHLGFSPCPNDTFIFGAIVNELIPNRLSLKPCIEDVELLNKRVLNLTLEVSKLSFSTLLKSHKSYKLLDSGSALGENCGPLLVGSKKEVPSSGRIAIPGDNTTAALLLQLAGIGSFEFVSMRFDEIIPSIISKEIDYGVIIHESRFTYQERGLHLVFDLGEWWSAETSLPLPLGGIAVKNSLSKDVSLYLANKITESIQFAENNFLEVLPFIKKHSQELSESIIRQHIDLYVNSYSLSLGEKGRKAILELFRLANNRGLISDYSENLFVESC